MTSPPSPYWSSERHADRRPYLAARTAILRAVRNWFEDQGFTEVAPPMLVASPGAETHVDAFEVDGRYLHTSPEFAMKKLIGAGERNIFYLGKCWRRGELGPLHAPEFTMIEWYRAGAPYETIMDDCIQIARVAARAAHADAFRWRGRACDPFAETETLTVREAFAHFSPSPREEGAGGGMNLGVAKGASLPNSESSRFTPPPYPLPHPIASRSGLINHGIAARSRGGGGDDQPLTPDEFSARIVQIESHLGSPSLTLLTEYPMSEAALARACPHDPSVAERFELYACGVELANGFGELTDPIEQRARLEAAMAEKEKRYGKTWPIDEDFLAALAHMPPASGCAMGFDRLVMLATGARHINQVLWVPYENS